LLYALGCLDYALCIDYASLFFCPKLVEKPVEVTQLNISPAINASVQKLLLLFEQQFVATWYSNFSATDKRFPEAVRLTLETVIMNFLELCKT